MLLASAVVVWEWLNEHGRWRPYSPAVSHHIEAAVRAGPRAGGSVVLGQVDRRLAPYIIDLHSMNQFRQDTVTAPWDPVDFLRSSCSGSIDRSRTTDRSRTRPFLMEQSLKIFRERNPTIPLVPPPLVPRSTSCF